MPLEVRHENAILELEFMASRHPDADSFVRRGLFQGHHNFSELEQRITDLTSQNERGHAFEVFAEAYLATQKVVQAKEVWPGMSVPLNVLKAYALPFKDFELSTVACEYAVEAMQTLVGVMKSSPKAS